MADSTPSKLNAGAGSFESRLSRADGTPASHAPTDKEKELLSPKKIDWAEDAETPIGEEQKTLESGDKATEDNLRPDVPEHDVEVKLADMQGDEANPLYSIHSFEELGMYVSTTHSPDPSAR